MASATSSSQSSSSTLWLPAPTRSAPPPPRQPQQQQLAVRGAAQGAILATTTTTTATSQPGAIKKATVAPSYERRCAAAGEFSRLTPQQRRDGRRPPLFVPRKLADFDDGGAYPEIHVAQYPRNMGNPHLQRRGRAKGKDAASSGTVEGTVVNSAGGAIVNVEIDSKGEVSYDAVVTGGTNTGKKVYTRHDDLKGTEPDPDDVTLPTKEEEARTAERTGAALQGLVSTKLAALRPTGSAMTQAATSQNQEAKTQFIKYTPDPDAPGYNPTASQRVIQMVPAQLDPMAPPKHMHKKAPRGPAEDPVPVLHAPPKKLTKEEREAWNVPACVSNWKNTRGYTIPLDKRLAADGRGLRENTINPNFATLSESLYVAERQAREEVRMRGVVQRRLAVQEKERREEELRELANRARLERTTAMQGGATNMAQPPSQRHQQKEGGESSEEDEASERHVSRPGDHRGGPPDSRSTPQQQQQQRPDDEDEVAARQRERLRIERKKERERELRLENRKGKGAAAASTEDDAKRRRLEEERDVSEKIALGAHVGNGATGGAGEVDARLYNTSAGLDSGFGAEDEYNAYSKPLFDRDAAARSIYKPTAAADDLGDADGQYDKLLKGSTDKFQPDKGFAGAEGAVGGGTGGPRTEPVQFEKGK